jgi:hypothetical protein
MSTAGFVPVPVGEKSTFPGGEPGKVGGFEDRDQGGGLRFHTVPL